MNPSMLLRLIVACSILTPLVDLFSSYQPLAADFPAKDGLHVVFDHGRPEITRGESEKKAS